MELLKGEVKKCKKQIYLFLFIIYFIIIYYNLLLLYLFLQICADLHLKIFFFSVLKIGTIRAKYNVINFFLLLFIIIVMKHGLVFMRFTCIRILSVGINAKLCNS